MIDKIIFMHLPKCAGSTFNSILGRIYLPENTFSIKPINDVKMNTEEFINLSQHDRDKIYLLKGHMRFGLHKYFSDNVKYITFLRDPIERVISYYFFIKRQPDHRLHKHNQFKEGMTLYDFVTKLNNRDINNGQIFFISGIAEKEELMLEKALENIEKHFSFIGIVEKFNESLILLKKMYKWSTPYYEVKNSTKNRPLLNSLDKKTLDAIEYFNAGDIALYKEMSKVLDSRIKNEDFLKKDLFWLNTYNKAYKAYRQGILNKLIPKTSKNVLKRVLN